MIFMFQVQSVTGSPIPFSSRLEASTPKGFGQSRSKRISQGDIVTPCPAVRSISFCKIAGSFCVTRTWVATFSGVPMYHLFVKFQQ